MADPGLRAKLRAQDISAIIVTRGNVDTRPIVDRLLDTGILEVGVHDNNGQEDLSVYGRYAAIEHAQSDLILVQDDDCLLTAETVDALLGAWEPGHVVCNMPERFRPHYPDSALVGFGALFERDLPEIAFSRFRGGFDWPATHAAALQAADFYRTCDVVFTTLTPRILIDAPVEILNYAYGPDRMYRQKNHVSERMRMLELARQVRDRVAA